MKKLFLFLLLLSGLIFLSQNSVLAQHKFERAKIVSLPAGQVVNKDFFASGQTVEINGTVNGDVYAAANQVLVRGTVNGDLIAAGGIVEVSGTVKENIRAAGREVFISGQVGRNLSLAGGTVSITRNAAIQGSLLAGGRNVSVLAAVGKGAKIGARSVTIANAIKGDLEVASADIILTSEANVEGNFTYWSRNKASIASGARIAGATVQNLIERKPLSPRKILWFVAGLHFILRLINLISLFILGFLFIKFFPRNTHAVAEFIAKRPWASLGLGFVALIITPVIFILLCITVLGVPLGFILLALYLIALYLTQIYVSFWAGAKIFQLFGKKGHDIWALVLGLIVYTILSLVPIVGGVVTLLVLLVGLGALLFAQKSLYLQATQKEIL